MIIGFLGKGGSGKSTTSTLMTKFLHEQGNTVLAVDADHNMDLSYNLGFNGDGPYIGGTFALLKEKMGIADDESVDRLFVGGIPERRFTLTPKDAYTENNTAMIKKNMHLMMAGPQNEQVLYGSHCSHSLAAPLKIYLPLLTLSPGEYVIVDEKASVDAVTTGIPAGFDLAVVCAEPREHSLRVAKQIIEMLEWYDVPYMTVLNKSTGEESLRTAEIALGKVTDVVIETGADPLLLTQKTRSELSRIVEHAHAVSTPNTTRLERTQRKSERNIKHREK
ncbi:MAG: AAA family ATPase [Minisyncoccia bacterium]